MWVGDWVTGGRWRVFRLAAQTSAKRQVGTRSAAAGVRPHLMWGLRHRPPEGGSKLGQMWSALVSGRTFWTDPAVGGRARTRARSSGLARAHGVLASGASAGALLGARARGWRRRCARRALRSRVCSVKTGPPLLMRKMCIRRVSQCFGPRLEVRPLGRPTCCAPFWFPHSRHGMRRQSSATICWLWDGGDLTRSHEIQHSALHWHAAIVGTRLSGCLLALRLHWSWPLWCPLPSRVLACALARLAAVVAACYGRFPSGQPRPPS